MVDFCGKDRKRGEMVKEFNSLIVEELKGGWPDLKINLVKAGHFR